jgi:hypothetical protein
MSRYKMPLNTLTRRNTKVKYMLRILEKIHVGSGYGSENKRSGFTTLHVRARGGTGTKRMKKNSEIHENFAIQQWCFTLYWMDKDLTRPIIEQYRMFSLED